MWKFKESDNYFVVYDNNHGEFSDCLEGASYRTYPAVGGFTKYVNGVKTGPSNIAEFHYSTISTQGYQSHSGSDQWLDLWSTRETSINYVTGDTPEAGMKCIVGRCLSDVVQTFIRFPATPEPTQASCKIIKASNPLARNGLYSLTPGSGTSFQAYCDMETLGGGW